MKGVAMSETVAAPEKRDSLSKQIYASLREGIIRGHYPQGSKLAEQRLAEELEVSRVPLREAVPLLEIDGFIQTFPRRGSVVSTWNSKAIHDLFDLRLCLEVGAARFAARRVAAGAPTAALEAALTYSQDVVKGGDAYQIAEASTWYHEAVVDIADNALLKSSMRAVSGRVMWLFFLTSRLNADDAYHDHVALFEAIRSGDERVSESIAYTHIERDRLPSFAALEPRQKDEA
jgi:DNA-binding GntR family transcriptional regulator